MRCAAVDGLSAHPQNMGSFAEIVAFDDEIDYRPFPFRQPCAVNPQVQTSDGSFGVRSNQFGFTVAGSSNRVVVVEASTSLANPTWYPLQTNTLATGSFYFSDPRWKNYPARSTASAGRELSDHPLPLFLLANSGFVEYPLPALWQKH
jgi:hypothetical protein